VTLHDSQRGEAALPMVVLPPHRRPTLEASAGRRYGLRSKCPNRIQSGLCERRNSKALAVGARGPQFESGRPDQRHLQGSHGHLGATQRGARSPRPPLRSRRPVAGDPPHRALADAGAATSVGSGGQLLRQRPGRVVQRPLQGRADPERRPLDRARRRGVRHPRVRRLVQPPAATHRVRHAPAG